MTEPENRLSPCQFCAAVPIAAEWDTGPWDIPQMIAQITEDVLNAPFIELTPSQQLLGELACVIETQAERHGLTCGQIVETLDYLRAELIKHGQQQAPADL